MPAYRNSLEHLFAELRRLDLILNLHVTEQRSDVSATAFNEFRGLFIAEDEIDELIRVPAPPPSADELTTRTLAALREAIARAERTITESVNESMKAGIDLALPRLARFFELSPFDIDALLICLAPELDLKYEKLYAYLQNDVTRKRPTIDLILKLCCRSLAERFQGRTRFLTTAPLVRHLLVQRGTDAEQTTWLSRALRIDHRILDYLLGVDATDERIQSFARFVTPGVDLAQVLLPSELKDRLVNCFREELETAGRSGSASVFLIDGPEGSGKTHLTEALCRDVGRSLIVANGASLVGAMMKQPQAIPALFREAKLADAVLLIERAEFLTDEAEKETPFREALTTAWQSFAGLVVISSREPLSFWSSPEQSSKVRFSLRVPEFGLRKELWRQLLFGNNVPEESAIDVDALADRFAFTPGRIHRAIVEARRAIESGATLTTADLNQACRNQSGAGLPALARRIKPIFTWNDIVLPRDQIEHLREVCAHIRHRQRVFGDWAFDRKVSLGKGVGILFSGASGTGKTMAAEIIANELALDLYKIDLSCIVSKYIGETEKNLSRVFTEAEQSNAILFFDEADAIFGKRSEVRDSHDRYANIEINYLLQKIEEYEGIVILASNFQKNIDDAFTRRLRFIIEFPFPEENYRERMWEKVFPAETPLDRDVDFDFLARKLKISGGNIRNIALHAAFLAAANSGHVSMEHIVCAARREFQKMGRLCVKSDFEQYFELIEPQEALV